MSVLVRAKPQCNPRLERRREIYRGCTFAFVDTSITVKVGVSVEKYLCFCHSCLLMSFCCTDHIRRRHERGSSDEDVYFAHYAPLYAYTPSDSSSIPCPTFIKVGISFCHFAMLHHGAKSTSGILYSMMTARVCNRYWSHKVWWHHRDTHADQTICIFLPCNLSSWTSFLALWWKTNGTYVEMSLICLLNLRLYWEVKL